MPIMRNTPTQIAGWAWCLVLIVPAHAEPSTSSGSISVAQVVQMLDQAPANPMAQQVLTAYLGGVGETLGTVIEAEGTSCRRPFTLTAQDVRSAIAAASGGAKARQVAATPLIVRDMMARAGCHRG